MISLATVKTFLGLNVTTYDAQITALIPIAEAKYREIAGFGFNSYFPYSYASGTTTLTLGTEFFSNNNVADVLYTLVFGDIIEGTGIPAESYITAINKSNGTITISAQTTSGSDNFIISTNISYRPVMASMIWYMIGQQSTTAQSAKQVASKSVGPLSITYAPGEINTAYGLPHKIVNSIPKYASLY